MWGGPWGHENQGVTARYGGIGVSQCRQQGGDRLAASGKESKPRTLPQMGPWWKLAVRAQAKGQLWKIP